MLIKVKMLDDILSEYEQAQYIAQYSLCSKDLDVYLWSAQKPKKKHYSFFLNSYLFISIQLWSIWRDILQTQTLF